MVVTMRLLKIKIYVYGPLPFSLNLDKLKKWKSSIFQVTDIQTINEEDRIYTDKPQINIDQQNISELIRTTIIDKFNFIKHDQLTDMILIISYVDLGNDWFLYSLKDSGIDNAFILSFVNIYEVLCENNIPLENIVISSLYTYSLVFVNENGLPTQEREREIMHLDTRGCLFDFTNNISDVKFYANLPVICLHCQKELIDSKQLNIKQINKELKKIRKSFFYRLYEDIKRNIITYLILTSLSSVFLTKVTSLSTYSNPIDIILTIGLAIICLFFILLVSISSYIRNRKHYSQNINSQRTK